MITPAYSPTATERVLPRMALDFTTGVLDPRVTVTRALDTATRVNSSGYIEAVNANLPRFDYNQTTLAPKGLLIEEARTNIVLQSSDASQIPWTPAFGGVGTLAVVTPNAGVSPDGTSNAVRVQFDCTNASSSSNRSRIQQIVTLINGTTYSKGVWVKAYDASNVGKTIRFLVEGVSGTLVYTLTDQWVRISPASGAATGTSGNFMLETRGTFTGQTADILMWNATLEAGAFLTSDIITSATSLTRNADAVSMTGTNFSDWFNANEGTFVATTSVLNLAANRPIMQTTTGGLANGSQYVYYNPSSSRFGYRVYDATGAAVGAVNYTNAGTPVINTTYGAAIGYKTDSFAISVNGAAVGLDTLGTVTGAADAILIGGDTGPTYLNGHAKSLRFYPLRLTNAETQAFSKG